MHAHTHTHTHRVNSVIIDLCVHLVSVYRLKHLKESRCCKVFLMIVIHLKFLFSLTVVPPGI
jgi:hypothetical protein